MHVFYHLLIFFQNQPFFGEKFRKTIRVSNSSDSDLVGHFVGPDLGPNCLQRLLADDTSRQRNKRLICIGVGTIYLLECVI